MTLDEFKEVETLEMATSRPLSKYDSHDWHDRLFSLIPLKKSVHNVEEKIMNPFP